MDHPNPYHDGHGYHNSYIHYQILGYRRKRLESIILLGSLILLPKWLPSGGINTQYEEANPLCSLPWAHLHASSCPPISYQAPDQLLQPYALPQELMYTLLTFLYRMND